MASQYSQSYYRALILHDDRFSLANMDRTGATEASPEPDQPVPDQRGFLQLEAFGSAVAAASKNVICVKEGAARGGIDAGGRFAWKGSTDAVTAYRGWRNYNKVTGWDNLCWKSGDNGFRWPHGLRTPDHHFVLVYEDVANADVRCEVRDPADDSWTDQIVYAGTTTGLHPTVVRLPDGLQSVGGRLLCFYLLIEIVGGTSYQTLGMSYSDDDGATWTRGGIHIAGWREASAGLTITRMRAVYHVGYITLAISGNDGAGQLWHLVSDDLGGSFEEVEQITATSRTMPELVVVPDTSEVVMVYTDTAGDLLWVRKGSAYAAFADDPSYDSSLFVGASMEGTSGSDFAVTIDDEGYLYAIWRYATASRYRVRMAIFEPADPNANVWTQWLVSGGTASANEPINLGDDDGAASLHDFCLAPYKDRLLLVTRHSGTSTATDESLSYFELGGYSSYDWRYQSFGENVTLGTSGFVYVPLELPATISGWNTFGAGSWTLTADGLDINTVAATTYSNRNGGAGNPILVHALVRVVAGGGLGADEVAIRARRANGVYRYDMSLRLTTTGARLYDNLAAANLADVAGLSSANYYEWLLAMEDDRFLVAYKLRTTSKWTLAATGSLTDGGAGAATNLVQWGNTVATTSNSIWKMILSACDDEPNETGIPAPQTNPDDLQGRPYSVRQLYLDGGTRIAANGSSAYRGDSHDLPTRYEYGLQNLDPQISASPAVGWRSTAETAALIRWNPEGVGNDTRMLSSTIGVGLFGINLATVLFQGYTGAAWQTLMTLDSRQGLTGLYYDLLGNWCTPDAGTDHAGTVYVPMDGLVGGYAVLDVDGSGGGPFVRKILRNSEGVWRDDNNRRVELLLDGSMAGVPATGDLEIRWPQVVGIRHKMTTEYEAFRLNIPAQTTAEGYFAIGATVVGPVAVFGRDYSWGRVLGVETNVATYQDAAGRRQKRQLGPNRRTAEFGWVEPVDLTELSAATPDPVYIVGRGAAGYDGIGVRNDATLLERILYRLDGGALPCVYLPRLAPATVAADDSYYTSPEAVLYGRIASDTIQRQTALGGEGSDETVTLSTVRIEEEV